MPGEANVHPSVISIKASAKEGTTKHESRLWCKGCNHLCTAIGGPAHVEPGASGKTSQTTVGRRAHREIPGSLEGVLETSRESGVGGVSLNPFQAFAEASCKKSTLFLI